MLSLPLTLPDGALLDADLAPISDLVADAGGIWLSFQTALLEMDGADIAAIRPRTGHHSARPTQANTGNARLGHLNGADVLETTERINCGFVLNERIEATRIGIATIFAAPDNAAKTLWCIDSRAADSAVVLTEDAGTLTLGARRGESGALLPLAAPAAGVQLGFADISPDRLTLMLDEGTPSSVENAGGFAPGEVDVYLACRRGREGLLNTLGRMQLGDVILFPDRAVCGPESADLRAALRRYAREVFGHGV